MTGVAIRMEKASFSYDGSGEAAVRDVSLEVSPGECVVLCGASGCGKTTITRLANGLAGGFWKGRRSGTVRIGKRNLSELEEWEISQFVGSVFQNPRSQFFNLDTTGELAFGMENLGVSRQEMHSRMRQVTDELGIEDLMGRSVLDLSGGQMQAIAFASAHACGPGAYVLDEPSSNLDPPAMRRLASFVAHAKAAGAAVLVAEHRLAYLSEVADRYVLVESGIVTHEWDSQTFLSLSDGQRAGFGLRSSSPPSLERLADALCLPPSATPSVEARGLVVAYGKGEDVLNGTTASFDAGTVTGIAGPNGVGKSTLLKCLAGIRRETFGHVRLDGKVAFPKQRQGRVFLVMQDPDYQLFRPTVRAEIAAAAGKESTSANIEETLGLFGLQEVAERHPSSLSGGQKQRVVCALARASGARVILLDEPTSGLDFGNMVRLAAILRSEASAGRTVAVVSHDAEFLARACDRIILVE